jgi:hypothetical protein
MQKMSPPNGYLAPVGGAVVLALSLAALVLHIAFAQRYGIFRDELYYLACAEHLDWGYVDQPPLIALVAWFARHVFGESLLGLRLLPAIASAATVWLTGKLTREMGGGRFAQGLACCAVLTAPIYLILQHWLTMNAFEPLLWMGCAWCALRVVNTGRGVYWVWFGVIAGIGLENKYTMAFFGFAIVVGLLLTNERRWIGSPWMWLGGAIAFVLFLPNLIWLIRHGFPFLELMHNIRQTNRDVVRGPLAFILDQGVILGPAAFPLWLGGVVWLFSGRRGRRGRRFRFLGWTYIVVLIAMIALKGKNYYLSPVYPMLFAAGAIALEHWTSLKWIWLRPAYTIGVFATSLLLTPMFLPVLSPEQFVVYQQMLGFEPPKAENQNNGPLPQYFADQFGWEEMVRKVARVYNSLPPDERTSTAIFANGYGEAAAIDFFGPKYGLPKAISNHQNYWLWGPRNYTGQIVIVLGSNGRRDREHFASVVEADFIEHPYSRRDEHFPILLCRRLNMDLRLAWPSMKKWI